MTVIVLELVAAAWALGWTVACFREAVRLHRQLYPRGLRFVFSPPKQPTTNHQAR